MKEQGVMKAPFSFSAIWPWLSFWGQRYARLMPTYWVMIIFTSLPDSCQPIGSCHTGVVPDPVAFFLLPNPERHEWFVNVMLKLCFLYPFLERILLAAPDQDKPTPRWWIASVAIGAAVIKLMILGSALERGVTGFTGGDWWVAPVPLLQWNVSWYTFFPFRVPEIVMGMMIPHLRLEDASPWLWHLIDVLGSMWFLFILLVPMSVGMNPTICMAVDLQIQAPVMALIIWRLLHGRQSYFKQVFEMSLLVPLATCSYGFYLFQLGPVMDVMGTFDMRSETHASFVELLATFLLTYLIAWSCFVVVEEPAGDLVKRMLKT
ncbi:unnamed protein product [Polarella glacialis]|nr:unnamed protein product [Polarella glacialis]